MIDPTYTQRVMRLPPPASANNPCFVYDYFSSFTSTIFLGQEVGGRVGGLVGGWRGRLLWIMASQEVGSRGGVGGRPRVARRGHA